MAYRLPNSTIRNWVSCPTNQNETFQKTFDLRNQIEEPMSRQAKLEAMLADDPNDPFLHYALALELVKGPERSAGLQRLADMNRQFPDHVPAYFRLGQFLSEEGDFSAARKILEQGIAAALRTGDDHAAAEMRELVASFSD